MKFSAMGVSKVGMVRNSGVLIVALAGLALGGCDRKDASLATLTNTSRTLRSTGGTGEASRKTFSEITTNLAELSRNGESSGATASMLIAVSQLGLSDADVQTYLASEAECQVLANQVRTTLSKYLSLHEAAKGADAFSVGAEMGRINGERAKYQEQLTKAQGEQGRLGQQVTALNSDAKVQLDAANAKLAQAAQITDKLAQKSSAEAATATEQAHALKVEAEAARRAGLELQAKSEMMQPVLDEWTLKIAQYENLLQSLSNSEKSIQEQERLAKQTAADSRTDAGNAANRIAELVGKIQTLRTTTMTESSTKALATFKKAIDATRELGKPTGNQSQASLLAALAQQGIGELHWSMASGHGTYAATMKVLAEVTPPLPASADYGAKATAAAAAQVEASDAAKAAFEEAHRGFDRAASGATGPNAAGVKEQLKALASRYEKMSGKASDSATDAAAAPAADTAAAPTASGATDPALKAVLEQLVTASKNKDMATAFGLMHAPDAASKEMLDTISGFMKPMARLDAAMKAKFGKTLEEAAASMPGAAAGFGQMAQLGGPTDELANVSIDSLQMSVNGDSATVTGPGLTTALTFVKVDGQWKMQVPEMGEAASSLAMMKPMMGPVGKAMDEVAAGVENGTHATAEAAMQAMGMKIMQGMQGGGG